MVPGLDYCFQNYGVGGIGYRYINTTLLDTNIDLLHPEAIIYTSDENRSIRLGAVEYMMPVSAWDAGHSKPPQILGQSFHLNEKLDMYVLHAWIWNNNPSGMFEARNPDVSCPAPLKWMGPCAGDEKG